jgi:acyl carrier protein
MAASIEVPADLRRFRQESLRAGLTPAEGIEIFERALRGGWPQVAVSRYPLRSRLSKHVATASSEELAEFGEVEAGHARPTLATAYAPPGSELEKRLAAVWQELLGLDQVGIDDNFFELGGNSLIGLKIASRIKTELGAEISPVVLFEGPTVRSLARIVDRGEDETPATEGRSRGERRRARRAHRRGAAG